MKRQVDLFEAGYQQDTPEGFRYQPSLISEAEQIDLVARITELPFREFDFHGFKGKRRIVSFGWRYEYSGRGALHKAEEIPEFLFPIRERVASFVGIEENAFQHVLITEYRPGAGIGWHRDKAVFGQVVGVSLLTACVLRFRRKVTTTKEDGPIVGNQKKPRSTWERVNVTVQPRSAYILSGSARSDWQHSIAGVAELRYSITFRTKLDESPTELVEF